MSGQSGSFREVPAVNALSLLVALPILFARRPGLRSAGTSRYRDTFHFHGLEVLRVEWA